MALSAASGRGRQGLRNVRQPAVGRDVKSRVLLLPESRNQMKRVIDTVTTLEDLVAHSSGSLKLNFLFGSDAEKIIEHAPCPVLVVR